ncbi:hypothetical protein PVAND_002619 [Polypedilum vanderplanki]|uniref:SET domain-containing protein n=1 Tax=Polypedilum vanderplanki TaxID=319348 RepID=A0A9J6BS96_POLVA|nr:hypothetical protein PVAND_002619 [Polypedilum vanderplanki]
MNNPKLISMDGGYLEKVLEKNDLHASNYRIEGNIRYSNSEFFRALVCYNKALAFAKSKELIALAYGNRSAVYFVIKRYDECLENIRFARLNSYPQEKIENLNEREKKCVNIKRSQKQGTDYGIWDYIKLSYPANKEIPWIIEGLEMRTTKRYDRGIYTTQDLQPGDIICIEEISAIFNLDENDYYNQCANCMKTKMLNLIPCIKSASFMFCSIECRNEFYSLFNFSSNEFNYLVFSLSKIERAFGGRKQLISFLKNYRREITSFFDDNFLTASKSEIQLNAYKSLLSSSVPVIVPPPFFHKNDKTTNDLLHRLANLKLCNVVYCLRYDDRVIGTEITLRQMRNRPRSNSVFSRFFGLINYKCIANVESACIDNKIVCYVKQPIKANEQLFYNNLDEFYNQSSTRDMALFGQGIKCTCIACTQHYNAASIKRENPKKVLPKVVNVTQLKKLQDAIQNVKENFDIIKEFTNVTSLEHQISVRNLNLIFAYLTSILTT